MPNKKTPKAAMILAAGMGERLKPLTLKYPKPILPIANQPMIEWTLYHLATLGVKHVVINIHHLAERVRDLLGNGSRFKLKIDYSVETTILGTGGGIAKMLSMINEADFICCNGDSPQIDHLQDLWQYHLDNQSVASMLLRQAPENNQEGIIYLQRPSQQQPLPYYQPILGLLNYQPPTTQSALACNFIGVHAFNSNFLQQYFSTHKTPCINRDGYHHWLMQGHRVGGLLTNNPMLDTGTIPRYLATNRYFLERFHKASQNRPHVIISPPVLIADDVIIEKNVTLGPAVSIAKGAHIGHDAKLENCIVLENARIMAGQHYHDQIIDA